MRTAYKQSTRVMLRSKQAVFFHSFQCFFLCSETSIYSFKLRFKCERQKKQCLRQFSIFRWKLSSNRTESLKYLRQLNNLSVLPKTKKKNELNLNEFYEPISDHIQGQIVQYTTQSFTKSYRSQQYFEMLSLRILLIVCQMTFNAFDSYYVTHIVNPNDWIYRPFKWSELIQTFKNKTKFRYHTSNSRVLL